MMYGNRLLISHFKLIVSPRKLQSDIAGKQTYKVFKGHQALVPYSKFYALNLSFITQQTTFGGSKGYNTGDCNNNDLWNIHVIIPCRRSFSVLVIISPYTNRRLFVIFSKRFYW